jgi:hypothetical protein
MSSGMKGEEGEMPLLLRRHEINASPMGRTMERDVENYPFQRFEKCLTFSS